MTTFIVPRRTLALFAAVGLTAIAAVVAFVYLPSATITLHPTQQERSVEREMILSSKATEPDFARYILPARLLETSVTEEKTIERVGATVVEDFATGQVQLVNTRDEVQELLPKTHLRHQDSGVFFLTNSPVAIPAKGSVAMAVVAKEKGDAGNVPAGRFIIDKLPAELQSDVYAESKAAFTGGSAVETPLSEEEIAKAREEVAAAASERARGELTAQAGGAGIQAGLLHVSPEEEIISAAVGSKAKSFTVKLTAKARAFVVNDNDLLGLTLLALRSAPAADEEFVSYRPESFRVKIIRADFDQGEARVAGALAGMFASKIGPAALDATALAGLSAEEVQAHFKGNSAVGQVEVEFSPFWVRAVPGRRGAVEVRVSSE